MFEVIQESLGYALESGQGAILTSVGPIVGWSLALRRSGWPGR